MPAEASPGLPQPRAAFSFSGGAGEEMLRKRETQCFNFKIFFSFYVLIMYCPTIN